MGDGADAARDPMTKTRSWIGDPCDVCGGPTFERHCKVICCRCGYTRDCSDP